jgi:hypothetical protein
VDGDILGLQSGPDFELFVKSGVTAFGLEISEAAWKLARGETAAGQPSGAVGDGTAGGTGPAAAAADAGAVTGAVMAAVNDTTAAAAAAAAADAAPGPALNVAAEV